MIRSPSKNMCSVRHRPIPSAPKSRATLASCGVSALVRTVIRRTAVGPAHQSPEITGQVSAAASFTSPHEDLTRCSVNRDDVAFLEMAALPH